jgi:hypothetical protein
MAFRVLKPISADDGSTIPTGTLVEAEGWRNLRALINGRYLGEVAVVEVAVVDEAVDAEVVKPKAKKAKVVEEVTDNDNL